jgi:nucleoside-diphosphate-sugar epimerase
MKVLLIGGNSALGGALNPVLSRSYEVYTAGLNDCDIFLDLKNSFSASIFPSDIDVFINTAASFGGTSDSEIFDAEIINVIGTLNLCQAAVSIKAKHFILISTIYSIPGKDTQYHNAYSISKRHGEEIAKLYCSINGMPLTILRPSPIYGVHDQFRKNQPLLYYIVDKAQKGEDFIINGSHDPLRNFIFIDDLTMIISKIIQNQIYGDFNCTHPDNVTFSEIAKIAYDACKVKANVLFDNTNEDVPDKIFDNDDNLYKLIDYYPITSIADGIKKIISHRKSIL